MEPDGPVRPTWLERHWFKVLVAVPWVVFAVIWFVPLTVDQVRFGGTVDVASCPAPVHYIGNQSGYVRGCDANALGRVVAFGMLALASAVVLILVRATVRDLTRRSRAARTTAT